MNTFQSVYFLGIGGIGMSALARYFHQRGLFVAGYDRVPSELTRALEAEGILIHYEDNFGLVPDACKDPAQTLVVFTPAIPADFGEFVQFKEQGFEILKRAQVLGFLTKQMKGLCVAGTHGKTTTTAMTAHILHESHVGCNAFLGGISKNYGTNYLFNENSPYVVIEADEFDRSFHQLRPWATVITAVDADHLDIYGTPEAYRESFSIYTSLIKPECGALISHTNLPFEKRISASVANYEYSRTEGDFHAENVRIGGGEIHFDYISPLGNVSDVELGVPVSINIENAVAAIALAQLAGATGEEIRRAMKTFKGVNRRFDFKIKTNQLVFLSDYAHHPEELRQSITSIREVFNGRTLTGIFQPHLYTRTRDFYREFAESLSLLDEVILLDIYPAREKPIEGVSSQLIYDNLRPGIKRQLATRADLPRILDEQPVDVLMVLGAGDADDDVPALEQLLRKKYNVIEA
ncbi:MAG: UDP-N-acetylmuramate--L-alanine ligase [Alloprevotella sp.]|nr:UDP-N-acetylmuramate--L-alanine ligase [Alloprevotella sp.]